MHRRRVSLGPAVLVTAAFVGPGTITACTLAGTRFGYALVWALVFSVCATLILQEMAARLGLVTGNGLGTALRAALPGGAARAVMVFVVLSAIVVGNAAYEGGNLAGAALGVQALSSGSGMWTWLVPTLVAGALLETGYRTIERVLVALVAGMSLLFVLTAVLMRPSIVAIVSGVVPSLPQGSSLSAVALIGTTVVPYSLFLHAAAVRRHWSGPENLTAARRDTLIAIPIGGLVSLAIMSTAAAAFFGTGVALTGGDQLASQLEPLLGSYARIAFGAGLLAAGLTSAVTAPLAAAYAASEVLGWEGRGWRFRSVWMGVLGVGALLVGSGARPLAIIQFAQIANGLLLPVVACYLLWAMNSTLLGRFVNTRWQNVLGVLVVAVSVGLAARSIASGLGLL